MRPDVTSWRIEHRKLIDLYKKLVTSQFEAALCMFNQCVAACPPKHWEGKIANGTFRWAAYHTLFFVDCYLAPSEDAFRLRDLNVRGGDEREPTLSLGLEKDDTLAYVAICRQKVRDVLAAETETTLAGPSGFSWRKCTRAELHVYNLRHLQHHTGQLSAYLRRVDEACRDPKALPWVGQGWRD
jgi:hypothetical protein